MTIRCKFTGGPLDGQLGHVASLDQAQIFFDKRQRTVYLYNRVDETEYEYYHDVSLGLTRRYDEAYEKFGDKSQQSVEFEA